MPKKLYLNGYEYVDRGPAPCPMPGHENAVIATDSKGVPAWWQDGHIFVRNAKNTRVAFNQLVTGWAEKIRGVKP